uniref:Uncharacterized protein n=1 Tax=Aegilops tauschii subsp. strangulata TaxID=200361 RepID=A0A453C9T8_AEGTS
PRHTDGESRSPHSLVRHTTPPSSLPFLSQSQSFFASFPVN